ncbi:DUF6445 family protein [Nostoc sphaeroides]|uniref:Uncharacterized protein n=1 Tax=Nostoc sphaeroides CCNUC1 TaxID=2653204 RepID=A0A5P8WJB8_9NOSO|nr:DUF6445 family protein [Nostoc sphaeroides]QFS52814.1 hypothetical protein GXM_10078 [Nostoc sphaeroides CCNUC1]
MPNCSIIVIDNFYDDPDEIRKLALSLNYSKDPNKVYPGAEGIAIGYDWTEVMNRMRSYIDEPCQTSSPLRNPPFPQGKFNLALASDENKRLSRVHVDLNRWAGVVYLSRPEDCCGGTSWYRHRASGAITDTQEWMEQIFSHCAGKTAEEYKKDVLKVSTDMSQWEEIQRVAMVYNRALILMAHTFHATTCLFGTDINNGRLTQHFELYTK